MGYRKFFSIMISIVLVVVSFCSMSFADSSDAGRTYTTPSGITLILPPEYEQVLWPGIDEDDPFLAETELDKETVTSWYERGGIELQSVTALSDNGPYLRIIIFELNTPSDLDERFADTIRPMAPECFITTDMFGYGMVEKAGIPFYFRRCGPKAIPVLPDHRFRQDASDQYHADERPGRIHRRPLYC